MAMNTNTPYFPTNFEATRAICSISRLLDDADGPNAKDKPRSNKGNLPLPPDTFRDDTSPSPAPVAPSASTLYRRKKRKLNSSVPDFGLVRHVYYRFPPGCGIPVFTNIVIPKSYPSNIY